MACFQVISLSLSASNFRRLGLPNRGFRIEGIAKIDFPGESFSLNFGMDLYCFLEALGVVSLISIDLRTSLKIKRFLKILHSRSGGADRGGIWAF